MFAEFELVVPPALLSCLIPAGQLSGYMAASPVMAVTTKVCQ